MQKVLQLPNVKAHGPTGLLLMIILPMANWLLKLARFRRRRRSGAAGVRWQFDSHYS